MPVTKKKEIVGKFEGGIQKQVLEGGGGDGYMVENEHESIRL